MDDMARLENQKERILTGIKEILDDVFGKILVGDVLSEITNLCWRQIKPELRPHDFVNYHDVVKIIKDMKFPDEDVAGPEMANHNDLLDRVHNKLKEYKSLTKKAE